MELKSVPVCSTLSLSHFELLCVIGKGSFAKVVLARHIPSSKLFALKVFHKNSKFLQNQTLSISREISALRSLQPEHFVLSILGAFHSPSHLYLVLEYCPGGELMRQIQMETRMEEERARFYVAQVVLVLEKMHEKGFIYRDLKPENVLVGGDGFVRMADFGMARELADPDPSKNAPGARSLVGTKEYLAPELLEGKEYTHEVDWWTVGCFAYELLVGVPPFRSKTDNRAVLFDKICNEQPKFPKYLSVNAKNFIEKCLKKNPSKRLGTFGALDLKMHPWLADVEWDKLQKKEVAPPFIPSLKNNGLENFDDEFKSMKIESDEENDENDDCFKNFSFESQELQKTYT